MDFPNRIFVRDVLGKQITPHTFLTYACFTTSCEGHDGSSPGDESARTEHKQDEGRGQVWVAP